MALTKIKSSNILDGTIASEDLGTGVGGAASITDNGNTTAITINSDSSVDIPEHKHSVGGGLYAGEFFKHIEGTSWTDVARINFNNGSWGSVILELRYSLNSNSGDPIHVVYYVRGHAALNGGNVNYYDLSGEGVDYINWVNESNGNIKLQLKTAYSTDDAAVRITYEMNHRTSQDITVEKL